MANGGQQQAIVPAGNGPAIDRVLDEDSSGDPRVTNLDAPIGRVVSVAGSQVMVLLDELLTQDASELPIDLQIGAVVKMFTHESTVFGMVSGLSIPIPSQDAAEPEMMMVELELIGEAIAMAGVDKPAFQRGVSFCPSLRSAVYTTTHEDLQQIYAQPAISSVRIGTIFQDQTLPAFIATDDLLGKHFAILGTTGSGKSCAVALILRAILSQHSSGHAILLDLHNEYGRAFADCAEILGPGSLELPYWLLNFEEIREIVIGRETENREADAVILKEAILEAKRRYHSQSNEGDYVTADTPVPYRLSDVTAQIDEALGKLDKPTDSAPYLRLKERLSALQSDKRFTFMFQGITVRDNMAAIVSRIFRLPVEGKPVTILDLSAVPSEILLRHPGCQPRLRGDQARPRPHRQGGPQVRCLALSGESEALGPGGRRPVPVQHHLRHAHEQPEGSGVRARHAVGIGARPARFAADLRTGEAIAVGEGVSVPARLRFDTLAEERKPLSGTASFSAAWQNDDKGKDFAVAIIERWRRQRR
jgi:hypothetical protein